MNHTIYRNKIKEIEEIFNAKYTPVQMSFLWGKIQKWQESTFLKVVNCLCDSFKPSYGVPLPLPAHFNEIRDSFSIQEEQDWKKKMEAETPADIPIYAEYQRQVKELMKKWTGNEDFKPKTAHIENKFICDICFRAGCTGKKESALRTGCPAFLSEERHKKILESLTPEEIEIRNKAIERAAAQ